MPTTIDISGGINGTWTIEDDGVAGNGTSVVRDPNGVIFTTFAHPVDSLTFVSRAGQSFNVNITDSLGGANVTIGSLTNAAIRPDAVGINFLQTAGTITIGANTTIGESGLDAQQDLLAGTILLRAGTGIGSGNALRIQTGILEAESNTGGINIYSVTHTTIGGGSSDLGGLRTVSSGNITLRAGSIVLADGSAAASVDSAGSIELEAWAGAGDISATSSFDALVARGGNITLRAERDVLFGTGGIDFDNDVRAAGSIAISAGRDFTIDGFSDMASNDFGTGSNGGIAITAGRDVNVSDAHGVDASIGVSTGIGNLDITTGEGGTLNVTANSAAALFANGGSVNISADRVSIDAGSGITTTSAGGYVRFAGATLGRAILLGSATDGLDFLELSDAELDRVNTQNLRIGSALSGELAVVGAVSLSQSNVLIETNSEISVEAAFDAANTLTLRAGDDFVQTAAGALSATTLNVLVDTPDTDRPGGSTTFAGAVTVTTATQQGAGDADTLRGIEGVAQIVHGNGGNDTIFSSGEGTYFGDDGNDIIHAGASSGIVPEILVGGTGDDFYFVSSASDVVVEAAGEGADRVFASTHYTLGAGVHVETLSTADNAGLSAINLTGNELVNSIVGNAGNNVLDGKGGADTLNGQAGDDWYFVENAADVVIELAGWGTDRVFASTHYTLGTGVHVETLSTTDNAGLSPINLTGNELVNSIVGNAGNNVLDGKGGVDTMNGQAGDDWYFVDNAADVVVELAGWGTDRVFASTHYTLGAGVHVETLSTTDNAGLSAINLTGNELVNSIVGNAGNNVLDGKSGADTLNGQAGNDWYFVDNAADVVIELAGWGTDRVFAGIHYTLGAGVHVETLSTTDNAGLAAINLTGNELANAIVGNAGSNVLDGKGGADVLNGSGGADTFQFTTALGAGNVDAIQGYTVADDVIHIDNAVFTGLADGVLAAGAFRIGAAAADADDRIIYNSATGALLFDADGNGAGAAVQFATLDAGLAMIASEFLVI